MIKKITDNGTLLAIVGSMEDMPYGNNFITEPALPMQLGIVRTNKGAVQNHIHKIRNRQSKSISNEFHMIVSGKAIVSIFNYSKELITKVTLCPNMFCALFNGGHGYEFIKDDTIMIEVKLGNFDGVEVDKEKF